MANLVAVQVYVPPGQGHKGYYKMVLKSPNDPAVQAAVKKNDGSVQRLTMQHIIDEIGEMRKRGMSTAEAHTGLINQAKQLGIKWDESPKEGVNWSRASKAMIANAAPAPKSDTKYNFNPTGGTKMTMLQAKFINRSYTDHLSSDADRQTFMSQLEANGITWTKHAKAGINWMRASMALTKFIQDGGSLDVSATPKDTSTPTVTPSNTPSTPPAAPAVTTSTPVKNTAPKTKTKAKKMPVPSDPDLKKAKGTNMFGTAQKMNNWDSVVNSVSEELGIKPPKFVPVGDKRDPEYQNLVAYCKKMTDSRAKMGVNIDPKIEYVIADAAKSDAFEDDTRKLMAGFNASELDKFNWLGKNQINPGTTIPKGAVEHYLQYSNSFRGLEDSEIDIQYTPLDKNIVGPTSTHLKEMLDNETLWMATCRKSHFKKSLFNAWKQRVDDGGIVPRGHIDRIINSYLAHDMEGLEEGIHNFCTVSLPGSYMAALGRERRNMCRSMGVNVPASISDIELGDSPFTPAASKVMQELEQKMFDSAADDWDAGQKAGIPKDDAIMYPSTQYVKTLAEYAMARSVAATGVMAAAKYNGLPVPSYAKLLNSMPQGKSISKMSAAYFNGHETGSYAKCCTAHALAAAYLSDKDATPANIHKRVRQMIYAHTKASADGKDVQIKLASKADRQKYSAKVNLDFNYKQHSDIKYRINGVYEIVVPDHMEKHLKECKEKAKQTVAKLGKGISSDKGVQHDPISCEMYHGTDPIAVSAIVSGGFKVTEVAKAGRMLGNGVYLAETSSKSMQYIGDKFLKPSYGWNKNKADGGLLVCEACLGRSITMTDWVNNKGRDYDSGKKGEDHGTVFGALGEKMPGHISGLKGDEWCVRDSRAVVPRYIIDMHVER